MLSTRLTLATLAVAPTLLSIPASADDAAPVAAAPAPGLTLPAGKVNLAVNLEIQMTADKVGKPVSVAPDVSYGVTPDLTVALVHSRFATSGFRAAVGGGLCVTGEDNGCPEVYDNVGVEGWYSLSRGQLAIAAGGGVHAVSLANDFYDLKAGAKLRYTMDKVAVHALPSVFIALTEREDDAGARKNPDQLWVPVQLTYKATGEVTVGVGSGIKGPLSGFGDAWEVPLGAMATYAIDPVTTVGGSWVFGKLVGGAPNPPEPAPAATGVDYRGLQVWGSRTF